MSIFCKEIMLPKHFPNTNTSIDLHLRNNQQWQSAVIGNLNLDDLITKPSPDGLLAWALRINAIRQPEFFFFLELIFWLKWHHYSAVSVIHFLIESGKVVICLACIA